MEELFFVRMPHFSPQRVSKKCSLPTTRRVAQCTISIFKCIHSKSLRQAKSISLKLSNVYVESIKCLIWLCSKRFSLRDFDFNWKIWFSCSFNLLSICVVYKRVFYWSTHNVTEYFHPLSIKIYHETVYSFSPSHPSGWYNLTFWMFFGGNLWGLTYRLQEQFTIRYNAHNWAANRHP